MDNDKKYALVRHLDGNPLEREYLVDDDGDTVEVTDLTTYVHRLINVAGDSCTMMIFDICRRIYDLWLFSLVLKGDEHDDEE